MQSNTSLPPQTPELSRHSLRQQLRGHRRNLSLAQQRQAARSLARQLQRLPALRTARHIALYSPADGEIDPWLYMAALARQPHRYFYLPVLHPVHHNRLWFRRVDATTALVNNRFGIAEPKGKGPGRAPWALDAVLMPLVGFAGDGSRLGMGGGFYDRTFAFVRHWRRSTPKLIGLAHECQRLPALPQADWDIAMHGIATDQNWYPAVLRNTR